MTGQRPAAMVRCLTAFIKCPPELVERSQQCDKARMLRQAQHDNCGKAEMFRCAQHDIRHKKTPPDKSTGGVLGYLFS